MRTGKSLVLFLLVCCCCLILFVPSAFDVEYDDNCICDDEEGSESIHLIQKVSDFCISVAYFSIPIELIYFVSRFNVPFKSIFVQFTAFIVLCGLTHFLHVFTYDQGLLASRLVLSLTIAKILCALVSCATAITLPPNIPQLLKIKIREIFLRQNVAELNQEVGLMKRQKEASRHVRMLTREIRKSLDKHTILYTTLVELSKALVLHNCMVWMPDEERREMHPTHELRANSGKNFRSSISTKDLDVLEIKKSNGARILRPESALGAVSSGGHGNSGAAAAIRVPMLRFSNFKGGTPERVETCYAILVLVLPKKNFRTWTCKEMEIVEIVADQVAVALSHAFVLEESQQMRQKLVEQNRALQQARKDTVMASGARKLFEKAMSHGMWRPMHTTLGLLSLLQEDNNNTRPEQKIISDTMLKVSGVFSNLVNDVMEISENEKVSFRIETKPFSLHSMMREAVYIAKCLCVCKGFGLEIDVHKSLPDRVVGDEERAFQVILHMIGYLLDLYDGGNLSFRVFLDSDSGNNKDDVIIEAQRTRSQNEYVHLKFDLKITGRSQSRDSVPTVHYAGRGFRNKEHIESLTFSMCKKLVQMMQGNIWISPNSQGLAQGMTLLLKFQVGPSPGKSVLALKDSSNSQLSGLKVVLADSDCVKRIVTKKLLEKLGCQVTAVSSGFDCLSAISASGNSFQIIMLDLHMPGMDGFEVAARIRNLYSHNWPLIIALTAGADEHEKQKCMQVGMNGFIQKPMLLHEMGNELKRILQRAGGN